MKKINNLLLFGILILVSSCQTETPKSDKSKPSTFANFYVRFLQNENQTTANASFRSGMTQQDSKPIKIEKGVFFHNGNMVERDIKSIGPRYQADYDGPFSETYKFQFKDPLKEKTDHQVQMNSISSFSFKGAISKSKGATLTWEGAPLNENESIVFLIKNSSSQSSTFEIKGKTKSSEVFISSEKLKSLELGSTSIYLVRKQSKVTQEPNLVILSETEFYTSEKDISITP